MLSFSSSSSAIVAAATIILLLTFAPLASESLSATAGRPSLRDLSSLLITNSNAVCYPETAQHVMNLPVVLEKEDPFEGDYEGEWDDDEWDEEEEWDGDEWEDDAEEEWDEEGWEEHSYDDVNINNRYVKTAPTSIDFENHKLAPAEIAPLRYNETGQIVAPYVFRIGLPPRLTATLLQYCHKMGIVDAFSKLLVDDGALEYQTRQEVQFNGLNWYIERPEAFWESNIHWMGTEDNLAMEDMLLLLNTDGMMDIILESIGLDLGFEGLYIFHVAFFALSTAEQGFIHHDFDRTDGGAYHLIFPLVLATNHTGPDLTVFSQDKEFVGGYKYDYSEGILLGDDVPHATAPVDYIDGEMRLVASIFLADINEQNAQNIASRFVGDYSGAYVQEGDPDFLLEHAGLHWDRNDPTKGLPRRES